MIYAINWYIIITHLYIAHTIIVHMSNVTVKAPTQQPMMIIL